MQISVPRTPVSSKFKFRGRVADKFEKRDLRAPLFKQSCAYIP